MSEEILKGNFKVKKPVEIKQADADDKQMLKEKVKKRVLAQLGGSMVYVEREQMNWDGDA